MITLTPKITQEEITKRVQEMGNRISMEYKDKDLVLIGILKGAIIFLADLTRAITLDHEIDLIGASSYSGTTTTMTLTFTKKPDLDLKGKDILIVEDIVDTGKTLLSVLDYLNALEPASVRLCALIDKTERREEKIDVHYSCFTLDKGFIVGYGLDYNESYRNLPAIFDLTF